MPELRQSVATREWVVIATERARRPDQFVDETRPWTHERPEHGPGCPFCPGNEHLTDEPVLVAEENGRWLLRVVPNKFPALVPGEDAARRASGIEKSMGGFGVHEVLVESPRHNATTALQTDAEVARTLQAFVERGRRAARDPRVQMTIFFKNHGQNAGTSLEHPHCQIISVPVVPRQVRQRLQDAAAWYDEHGSCVFCDTWRQELESGERVVVDGDRFVSFVPYAAFSPFHVWVMPKRHVALFTQTSESDVADLARVLRRTLLKVYRGLHDPDFNFVVRTAPNHEPLSRSFHWYLSIVPKVTRLAGFELGSGMFINTALPEESAKFLRGVEVG